MDDDDLRAYKPAPGDATGKTKPSKHTKKFKQMFGDETNPRIPRKKGQPAKVINIQTYIQMRTQWEQYMV